MVLATPITGRARVTQPVPEPCLYENFSPKALWASILAPPFLTLFLLFISTKIESSPVTDWFGIIILFSILISWGFFNLNLSKRLRGRQAVLCALAYPFAEFIFCLSARSYGCLAFSISY